MCGYFLPKNGDDLSDCHPLTWIDLPASLNDLPYTTRSFGVIGSSRAMSFPHGDDTRDLGLVGKRDLRSERLAVNRSVR